ncbi:hypothetical protein ACOSQ2_020947 [Xanthoceras sorbifolium]
MVLDSNFLDQNAGHRNSLELRVWCGVVVVYGISQGLGGALACVGTEYYMKDVQKVQPSEAQVYAGITSIPWIVKPLWGLLTDVLPIFGYCRRPYFMVAGYLAMIGFPSSVGSLSNITQRLLQTISFRGLRVQCLRVGNTEIPNDKKLEISLQHVYGIGRSRAHQILCDLSIGNKVTKDLTGVELNSLREEVSRYLTGEDLRRCIKNDIGRLVDIQCYRGIRHSVGLPCRGQRTSTNARTRKGKRVAIPGKKKPTR